MITRLQLAIFNDIVQSPLEIVKKVARNLNDTEAAAHKIIILLIVLLTGKLATDRLTHMTVTIH